MPSVQSHFPLPSYGTLAAQPSARLGLRCNLTSDSGRYIVTKEQGLSGPAHVGRHACLGLGGVPATVLSLCSVPRSQTQTLQYHVQVLAVSQAGGWQL